MWKGSLHSVSLDRLQQLSYHFVYLELTKLARDKMDKSWNLISLKSAQRRKEEPRGKAINKIIIGIVIVCIIIGATIWYAPAIISQFQNPSSNSSDASYTSLMLRAAYGQGDTSATAEFGDTEYIFAYISGTIYVNAPFQGDFVQSPRVGHSYYTLGIELKVENISSDYLSDYAVIKVKPTIDNYMFSTYRETKVDIPCEQNAPIVQYGTPSPLVNYSVTVSISSGIVNKTNQYTFRYAFAPMVLSAATLVVSNSSQSKQYSAYAGLIVADAEKDFNIEIYVYKTDSDRMILYVKPLY